MDTVQQTGLFGLGVAAIAAGTAWLSSRRQSHSSIEQSIIVRLTATEARCDTLAKENDALRQEIDSLRRERVEDKSAIKILEAQSKALSEDYIDCQDSLKKLEQKTAQGDPLRLPFPDP